MSFIVLLTILINLSILIVSESCNLKITTCFLGNKTVHYFIANSYLKLHFTKIGLRHKMGLGKQTVNGKKLFIRQPKTKNNTKSGDQK